MMLVGDRSSSSSSRASSGYEGRGVCRCAAASHPVGDKLYILITLDLAKIWGWIFISGTADRPTIDPPKEAQPNSEVSRTALTVSRHINFSTECVPSCCPNNGVLLFLLLNNYYR